MKTVTLKDIFTEAANLIQRGSEFGLKVGTAESCTGGLIGAAITAIDGSSSVFKGGIIAYDNSVKTDLLDVNADLLREHGAVSEAVCLAMAEGALRKLNVDICVSVTGIAGPKGGSKDKPVGAVWMGIAKRANQNVTSNAYLYNFGAIGRNKVRDVTCYAALKRLQDAMLDLNPS